MVPCGHSLCGECLDSLQTQRCPVCQERLPHHDSATLPRNYALLEVRQQQQRQQQPFSRGTGAGAAGCEQRILDAVNAIGGGAGVGVDSRVDAVQVLLRDLLLLLDGNSEITVRTLTGRTFKLRVDLSAPVRSLKEQLRAITGVAPRHQRLIFGGKQLQDDHNLNSYDIRKGVTVDLVLRMRGGGRSGGGGGQ